jgi:serine O-acetyltransferase
MNSEMIERWLNFALRATFAEVPEDGLQRSILAFERALGLIFSDFLRTFGVNEWDDAAFCKRFLNLNAPFQAVLLYRISHILFLADPKDPFLDYLAYLMRVRTGAEVYYSSKIGEGFRIMHGAGIVMGPRHRIGNNFTIYQGVTLGQRRQNCPEEFLEIGNNCICFAGTKILGNIKIGHNVKIAANAVLLTDAEAGTTYGGIPARRIA